jgi:hypothetical protein
VTSGWAIQLRSWGPSRPLWCWGRKSGRCIHLEVLGEFYEDDEPIEKIQQARARPPDFITGPPRIR